MHLIIRDTQNMVNLVRMEKGSSVIPKSVLIFSSPSREISEDYLALGKTSSFHIFSKSSTNHQPNIKLCTVGDIISALKWTNEKNTWIYTSSPTPFRYGAELNRQENLLPLHKLGFQQKCLVYI